VSNGLGELQDSVNCETKYPDVVTDLNCEDPVYEVFQVPTICYVRVKGLSSGQRFTPNAQAQTLFDSVHPF